jgi:hypothetical protein
MVKRRKRMNDRTEYYLCLMEFPKGKPNAFEIIKGFNDYQEARRERVNLIGKEEGEKHGGNRYPILSHGYLARNAPKHLSIFLTGVFFEPDKNNLIN